MKSILFVAFAFLAIASVSKAQPLAIGARISTVDSCLSKWRVESSDLSPGDSVCLGARFWDIEGHLLFHIDSSEHTLTKVDWSSYLPIARDSVEDIAKKIETTLGPCDRARNRDWVYWIWDNEEIHYLLGYNKGIVRMLEFEDQSSLEACMMPH